jgi:GNAT superfamily N-acetyltransferase
VIVDHVRAGDAERLKALRLRALREDPGAFGSTYEREVGLPDDWWATGAAKSADGREQRMFVAVDDDGGWLGMALARDDAGTAVLNAMWVAPEGRGRGVATALCDACAGWARERGFDALFTAVVAGNAAAERLYARAGFAFERDDTWTAHGRTLAERILRRAL